MGKEEFLFYGSTRIYSLLVRLALTLNDRAFAKDLIDTIIVQDVNKEVGSEIFGSFGMFSSEDDPAAYNQLEGILSLCQFVSKV